MRQFTPPRKNLTSCNHTISNVNRRSFLKGSAAVAAGLMANNLFDISQVFANPISPGNAPYITQLTPEMIEDNNTGWVYYGAEAKDRPLNPWDKAQMKPEDFDKDALKLRVSCYYPNAGDIGHGIHWETFSFLDVLRQLEIPRNVTKNSPLPSGKDTPGEEGTPCGRGRGPSPYHRV